MNKLYEGYKLWAYFLYYAGKAYVIKMFNAGLIERSGSVANY